MDNETNTTESEQIVVNPRSLTIVQTPDGVFHIEVTDEAQKLRELVDAVDLVLEYNTPNRIAHMMLLVEALKPEHLGWGSWLAAEGYKNYPKDSDGS